MTRMTRHVLLPLLAPLAIVVLYYTPVDVIGCANRGLAAFGVAIAGLLVAAFAAVKAIDAGRLRADAWQWWMLSSLILMLPTALLLGPLG